jgi:uncharacterized protein (TIGR04255 family)
MVCFPAVPEIHLGRAPLTQVICQVRYPLILRIATEQPVAFQERVRAAFPQMDIEQIFEVDGSPLSTEPPTTKSQPRTYRFCTADDASALTLAADSVALTTNAYRHWADFAAQLQLALDALVEVYRPAYAQRVGLRYINRLTLENTGLPNASDLLDVVRPPLTALLREPCWGEPPTMACQLLLGTGAHEKLVLRSGYEASARPALTLDLDHFVEGQVPLSDVMPLCERYHHMVYRAFRWCICDDKLSLFDPLDIDKGV